MICAIHKRHSPVNHTVEIHHIVPRAWQHIDWEPLKPWPDEARDPYESKLLLWDARVIDLCPTGHRNVHFYIVAFVKTPTLVLPVAENMATQEGIAMAALQRFVAVGGSLAHLRELHEWGEA